MVRNLLRPAHRAEEDRIAALQLLLPVVGQHPAVALEELPAREAMLLDLQADAEAAGGRFEHAQPLGHHFLADAVASNHGDSIRGHVVPCSLSSKKPSISSSSTAGRSSAM